MKTIKFQNKQVRLLLEEKEDLVKQGRKFSDGIEGIEKFIKKNLEAQNSSMEAIKPKDLVKRGDELQKLIDAEIDIVRKKVGDKAFSELQNMEKNNILFIVACERAKDSEFKMLSYVNELGELVNKIHEMKLAAIPKSLKDEQADLTAKKDELEKKRNKNALRVQKIKDRAIPIIQRFVKPKLGEYEDMETAVLQGENIVVPTYDRMEEFKAGFKKVS